MDLFNADFHWDNALAPLIEKYRGKKHPLQYENNYQLMIMVILSAQDSDANINKIAPALFKQYPTFEVLSKTTRENLYPFVNKVRNFKTKSEWIIEIATTLKNEANIPSHLSDLILLKGVGRKSANVIMREMKVPADGIIVDLHVIRVAPRIGLCDESKDGNKVEKQLMQILPKEIWGEIGMALSFLGRETCRPSNPKCNECLIQNDCQYPFKTI
ncbi:endonuclease III domain-containing protein [Flavobacterium aciduliphilum]|uniref:DNA-(Apurinic or apyrimidinic site) lyase /endonuclease III n=1 Tax=Flavobacterium aciduliphilum TaxID=1101402 RepID=A0A328YB82_9FLAO|nr:endonuclease III [Flavobacterium aciduliphilum]RAR70880.1 DNA-(apurinic or apyrimidinic site) lyase /endonuclease III [Flavobacterium aciduliphilum]